MPLLKAGGNEGSLSPPYTKSGYASVGKLWVSRLNLCLGIKKARCLNFGQRAVGWSCGFSREGLGEEGEETA